MKTSPLIETRRKSWRWYSGLMLLGFVYGVVNDVFLGRPEEQVSYEIIAIIPICMSLNIAYRFLRRTTAAAFAEEPTDARLTRWPLYAVASMIVILVVALWIPASPVYASLLDRRLNEISTGPIVDVQSRSETAKQLLFTAKKKKISLKPATLQRAGEYFVKASESDPVAWNTALVIAGYQSQNLPIPAIPGTFIVKERQLPAEAVYYLKPWIILPPMNLVEFPADRKITVTYEILGPDGLAETGAIAQPLSAPGLFEDAVGPRYVIIKTSAHLVLDGWDMKNIIFVGAHIVYHGGPATLENISYFNCDFDVARNDRGKQFVSSLIEQRL